MAKPLPVFNEPLPPFDDEETLPPFDDEEDPADAATRKALKTPPTKLPDLPKPKIEGLNAPDPLEPKPGSSEAVLEELGGGPFSATATITRPISRTADWMIEGLKTGPPKILSGYKKAASREGLPLDERAQGVADMISGTMDTARVLTPVMAGGLPGMLKAAPIRTLGEVALGLGGPSVVREAGKAVNAPSGITNLVAETTGIVPLGSLAKRSHRAESSPAATPPELPEVMDLPGRVAAPEVPVATPQPAPKVSRRGKKTKDPTAILAKLQEENAALKGRVASKVVDKAPEAQVQPEPMAEPLPEVQPEIPPPVESLPKMEPPVAEPEVPRAEPNTDWKKTLYLDADPVTGAVNPHTAWNIKMGEDPYWDEASREYLRETYGLSDSQAVDVLFGAKRWTTGQHPKSPVEIRKEFQEFEKQYLGSVAADTSSLEIPKTPETPEAPVAPAMETPVPKARKAPVMDEARYQQAVEIVTQKGTASAAFIQKELKLGAGPAKRILDRMEAEGIVGPKPKGNKPRLVQKEKAPEPEPSTPRKVTEVLSDESGSLDVNRVLDLFSKAKSKLTSKDPYTEKADAKADEGRITTGIHKTHTDYVRETHPVWALQHLVTETGRDLNLPITPKLGEDIPIPVEEQPAVLMESFSGTMGKVALKLMEVQDKLKPFTGHSAYTTSPAMFPAGAPGKVELTKPSILKEALQYGIRERHLERGTKPLYDPKTGEEFEYRLPNGESLVDNLAAMRKFEAESGPQKMQEIHAALKAYRGILSEQWDRLKDAGLISKEFYESSKLFNEKYIPFMRLDFVLKELNNDRTVPLGSKVFQVAEKEFQRHLLGSEREILDPMIGLVRSIYRTEFALAKNKISTSIANLADLPAGKDWVIPINTRTGKPNPIKDASGKKFQPGVPLGFEPISYIKDGKKQQVMVPKDIAEIVRSQDQEGMNAITKMMGFWGSTLRAGVVSHPRFWMSNMSRDYWTAVTTTGLDPVNWAKGFIGAFTRDIPQQYVPKYLERLGVGDAMYKQFLESGAAYGGTFENTSLPKTAENVLDPFWKSAAKKVWDPIGGKGLIGKLPGVGLLEWSGQTAELAPRLAVQNKALKQGKSKFESGWIARNSTINFAIGGAAMKSWYSIIPFLKGRTGAARTGIEYSAKHPGLSAMRLGINLGIPAITLYYANVTRFPEVWDSIEEDIKGTHLMWIRGDEKDARGRYNNIVSIPVDGIPAAFLGALTAGMEAIRGKDTAGWLRNAIQFFSDTSPVGFTRKGKFSLNELASGIAPPPVSALYTLGTGKDLYTGRDLERRPGVRRDAAPADRYNLSAKKPLVAASKALSKAGLEVSPHVLEETPSDLLGHWGRFAVDAMPSVEDDGKNTVQRGMDALKLHPFTKSLPQRPELELDAQTVTQARGSRFQDMSREIEAILKSKDKLSEAKARFRGLAERYPDRPQLAEEYQDMLQRMSKAKAMGMDATERMLYSVPSESRAELIDKALQQVSPSRRASMWKRWVQLRLVTPKVKAEMDLLREQRRRLEAAPVTK